MERTTHSSETAATPAGNWPTATPAWVVAACAGLWLLWAAFLVWMMFLRISVQSAGPY